MKIKYNPETNEIYNMHGKVADPTLIREEMAELLSNGRNLVDLVAEYYGLDRHELGNMIGRLQLAALMSDPDVMQELAEAHGLDIKGVPV